MIDKLFYIVDVLILLGYIGYIVLILINNKKKLKKVDGFNATKDILHDYDNINIVKNNGYVTCYNIKRKVIKIANKMYDGKSVSDVSIPLIEAGISAADNSKNKAINIFRYIIPNLKLLYILPIILIAINSVTYNISDAKVGVVFGLIFGIISFILINIKCDSRDYIYFNLKNNRKEILDFVNKVILMDKIILVGEIVFIMRCLLILFNVY